MHEHRSWVVSFSNWKINCTLLAKTGVSIAMMGWAGEKAFDFTLPNRALCIAIVQMFDWHDKKSGPALRSSTEQDGAE